jgi:hypothetical protein
LNISLETKGIQNILFRIYDSSGKCLADENQETIDGNALKQMNVSNLAPGVYFMSIYEDGRKVKTEKFIKN